LGDDAGAFGESCERGRVTILASDPRSVWRVVKPIPHTMKPAFFGVSQFSIFGSRVPFAPSLSIRQIRVPFFCAQRLDPPGGRQPLDNKHPNGV
jgi:hypothetical protein